MNLVYFNAARGKDGKFRYTRTTQTHRPDEAADVKTLPYGYCAAGCNGHSTPEEASAHGRLYMLDNAVYHRPLSRPAPCEAPGCREIAAESASAHYGFFQYPLCPKHHNVIGLDEVLPPMRGTFLSAS